MKIGTVIKELRKNKSIDQKTLAEAVGISTISISKIENDLTFPHKDTLSKIADYFNVPTTYILLMALDDSEIKEDKKSLFNSLKDNIKNYVFEV